jgi:hypothetical protein
MKGYIYTMFKGADPGLGWAMTDPIFSKAPTMGACMPNIRRLVERGDHIFAISGRSKAEQQYVVGGLEVDEKITALAAYKRLPENRQRKMPDGSLRGNVIVDVTGKQNAIDYHSNFEKRTENYILGRNPVAIETEKEIEIARRESAVVLSELLKTPRKERVAEVVGRWRRLNEEQVHDLREWMLDVKKRAKTDEKLS